MVYRCKFAPTIFSARQFVNHGHVAVNGRRVTIASYRVKEGDVIEVRDKSRQMAMVLEAMRQPGTRRARVYRGRPRQGLTAELVRAPALCDVPYPVMMEPNLVVEYYAKN